VAEPRLGGGIAVSVLFHGAFVAAFFLLRPGAPPPSPPLYRVQLFAAPPGERAVGVVQEQPAPVPETKPLKQPPKPVATKPVPKPTPKSVPVVKQTTPTPPAKTAPPKEASPAPTAGGGATGGHGADVANVETGGLEFPYQYYTANIIRQLILAFGQGAPQDSADVRFIIHRDGSVDVNNIQMVRSSRNYRFNQRVLGAVEQVADAKGFGPLPAGFREDILPVTVRFTPSMFK
jgi:protein TonB